MSQKTAVREKLVSFRVNDDEYNLISSLAQTNELSLSDYVRRRALGGEIVRPKMTRAKMQEVVQLLQTLQGEMGRQGNNVNQIARYLRLERPRIDFYDKAGILPLENSLRGLETQYGALREVLGKIWQLLGE